VRDRDGTLAVAKFPQKTDLTRAVLWEAVALKLATAAGVAVPAWRGDGGGSPGLVARPFRSGRRRADPFLSAMSMLGAGDREPHSYLEIADAIRQLRRRPWKTSGSSGADVFNILISNTDDHLRTTHSSTRATTAGSWSPAYD